MDYFRQLQYLKYISSQLPLFKDMGNDVYKCRCIICGDSQKDPHKMRGFFFKYQNNIVYKCHNCNVSMSLVSFLKSNFPSYYSELTLEEIKEKKSLEKPQIKVKHKTHRAITKKMEVNEAVKNVRLLSNVPEKNSVRQYMVNRGLGDYLDLFYYIPEVRGFMANLPKYKKPLEVYNPAVGIPHWSKDKSRLEYMQLRMLTDGEFRYTTLKVDADDYTPKIFGLERLSKQNNVISVTEGAFDSMFVDNCISISGLSDWANVKSLKEDGNIIRFVADNDWRYNKQVRKQLNRIINAGFSVVLLPKKYKHYKDINDMIVDGNISREELNIILNENTYNGLNAMIKLK